MIRAGLRLGGLCLLGVLLVSAQTKSTLVDGLQLPYKLALTPAGNLLVSEAGGQPNTGRISLVTRSGLRRSLIEGLPSAASNSPEATPIGPTGLVLHETSLYIAMAEGDAVRNGATQGSLVLNPKGPSAPLFHAVLRADFDGDPDTIQNPFSLKSTDYQTLVDGWPLELTNSDGAKATLSLLASFQGLFTDPVTVYRHSDPFALGMDHGKPGTLYVVDSGQNTVLRMDSASGKWQVLARFAAFKNPTAFGPPFVDSVPTSVTVNGGQLLVTQLSGFPFVPGYASVQAVDLATGKVSPWIAWLNSAIDLGMRTTASGAQQVFVLGFSSAMTATPPGDGQLWQYDGPVGKVIETFTTPTGMAIDPATGEIFVTELATGKIIKLALP